LNGYKILIVDDEDAMRELIRSYVQRAGYTCIEAEDGMAALEAIKREQPHLAIVDIMMPFMDGITLVQEMRQYFQYDTPVIFLTAKGDDEDIVHGLKIGGDDYMVKPFNPGELLARIESILRRTTGSHAHRMLEIHGPLHFDLSGRVVYAQDEKLPFTQKEFDLLLFLAKNKGKVFKRSQLLDEIWGPAYEGSERTVDTHIKTVRLKLKAYNYLIETVWGLGYKFEVKQ